jgi:hypothetical protein
VWRPRTLWIRSIAGTGNVTYSLDGSGIPAGATLIFQVHYTTNGKEVSDRSSVGVIFAKEQPEKEMHTSAFMNPLLILPAGATDVAVPTAIQFNQDVHLTALFPHTHLRGKTWDYKLVYPDGRTETVLPVGRPSSLTVPCNVMEFVVIV